MGIHYIRDLSPKTLIYIFSEKKRKVNISMKYEDIIKSVVGCGDYQIFMLNLIYMSSMFDGLYFTNLISIISGIIHR